MESAADGRRVEASFMMSSRDTRYIESATLLPRHPATVESHKTVILITKDMWRLQLVVFTSVGKCFQNVVSA